MSRSVIYTVDADGGLLLIRREQPIHDLTDVGVRWSLDHLFVSAAAFRSWLNSDRLIVTEEKKASGFDCNGTHRLIEKLFG